VWVWQAMCVRSTRVFGTKGELVGNGEGTCGRLRSAYVDCGALVHTAPAPLPLRVQVSRAMCLVPPHTSQQRPPVRCRWSPCFPSPLLVGPDTVTVVRFDDKSTTVHRVGAPPATSTMSGHGGADYFLMKSFVAAVATGDPSHLLSGPEETLGRGACLRIL
jgi:hypothetical protein